MIVFNEPTITGKELDNIADVINNPDYINVRHYSKQCEEWFEALYPESKFLLNNSCTQSLEFAAILLDIKPGDEVIMPSYAYVSTANAFVLRGATPVFVDIRPDTMNIDEKLVESAIAERTKAIVPLHYAGVGCEMDQLLEITARHNIRLIEDNAHGILAKYKGKLLGQFGDVGCISFDYMKNITCGEGGAILVNNPEYLERAEMMYENGTNRTQFKRGKIDKYTWKDMGSNFYPSDMNAAFLLCQLQEAEKINNKRLQNWNLYFNQLVPLAQKGLIDLPEKPPHCKHNAHIFFIKVKDVQQRTDIINYLLSRKIQAAFHYVPLHSSEFGQKVGRFHGEDIYTTRESERLLRLPIHDKVTADNIAYITESIFKYYD